MLSSAFKAFPLRAALSTSGCQNARPPVLPAQEERRHHLPVTLRPRPPGARIAVPTALLLPGYRGLRTAPPSSLSGCIFRGCRARECVNPVRLFGLFTPAAAHCHLCHIHLEKLSILHESAQGLCVL
ncbi:PREDICTED: uncharacterized protein LOC106146417 isoform X2 [Chinchilla lanigera]|uniref:uncharacterized protein LOC106146417 isoform X2 n=1 Tax=Chinchilla lanigera TaxID=34839 RepID=UPI0006982F37|nr:PREDICTED: uncharacterized protein LOC106146417 isoform X2 [Chinchilla lanigera]